MARKYQISGAAVRTSKNQKIGVCNHKTQLLSGITFTVSIKITPVTQ